MFAAAGARQHAGERAHQEPADQVHRKRTPGIIGPEPAERQLSDEKFLGKAPANIVEGMRRKLEEYKAQLRKYE